MNLPKTFILMFVVAFSLFDTTEMQAMQQSKNQESSFFLVIARQPSLVADFISCDPSLVNYQDDQRWTPLHVAAITGNVPIVHLLIKAGAHASARTKKNELPLQLAINHAYTEGNDEIVQVLAKYTREDFEGTQQNKHEIEELLADYERTK